MNSRTLHRQEAADKSPLKIIKLVVESTWATADELVGRLCRQFSDFCGMDDKIRQNL